jgi:glutamate racemase
VRVLAPPPTAAGERLQRLHRDHGGEAQIDTLPMPGLADLVEAGEIEGPRIEATLKAALAGPLAAGTDEIALGCTHYGFLRPALARLLPAGVEVLDASEPVARRVRQQLEAYGLVVPQGAEVPVACLATGDPQAFAATIERLRAAGAELPSILHVSQPTSTAEAR